MDDFPPRLALQLGMKPPIAIQIHCRQMEDAVGTRDAGGFSDIDFKQGVGQTG